MDTAKEYRRLLAEKARKARAEFLEIVNVSKVPAYSLRRTFRAINYIVKNMGRDSVVTDQLGSILLDHMTTFARKEVKRALRSGR